MTLKPDVSVIVPTLNEARRIGPLIRSKAFIDPSVEIIVSDGGSEDGTAAAAAANGAAVVTGPKGRGQQLVAGVAAARGDVLLFLHADTVLGDGAIDAVRTALADKNVAGGNFRLIFDGGDAFSEWLTGFYAKLRAKGKYYGDSAIFVRRGVYEALGGIRPVALMEDHDFVQRLERYGQTVCISDPPAVTSSRRFEGRRPWRIVAQWIWLHTLHKLGAPPALLAWLYRSTRHRPGKPQPADRPA